MGQYEEALATCEKAATLQEMLGPYVLLTALYAQRGEMDKAAAAKIRLLKLDPGFSIARSMPAGPPSPTWLREAETYVIPGLRNKAGIPERSAA